MHRNAKPLGYWTATSLVIGTILGSGIFTLPASMASFGTISLFSWVITAIGTLFIAFTFVNLNKVAPETGGAFLFAYKAYGEFIGFSTAATYWFGWCVATAGTAVGIMDFVSGFWPIFNEHSAAYSATAAILIKLAVLWLTVVINLFGVRIVGKVELISNIIKLLPLIAIAIAGLTLFHLSNITHYYNISGQSNWHAINGAAALALFAFTGMETAVIPSNDIKNHRTIAWATISGTLFVAILTIFMCVVLMGIFPATQLKNSLSPLTDVSMLLFGPWGTYIVAFCAILTIVGGVNGCIVVISQDALGAARKNLFPKLFADTNNRFNSPAKGIILSGIVMSLMLLLTMSESLNQQFNLLVLISSLTMVIPYFIASTAAMLLFKKNPDVFTHRQLRLAVITATVSSLYSFWIIYAVGKDIVFYGSLLFFAVFWVFFIFKSFKDDAPSESENRLDLKTV